MDLIERAAIAMAGGADAWKATDAVIKDQYREDARRAAEVLAKPVPWDEVAVALSVALSKHSGSLTIRRASPEMRERIIRDQVAALKLSRYTVIAGEPVQGWGLLGNGCKEPDE